MNQQELTLMPESLLKLDDSRRLTGKSLLLDQPGAILDAKVQGFDKQQVVAIWTQYIQVLLAELGWQSAQRATRIYEDGISLAFSAPQDVLYAATEVNEAAWQRTCAHLQSLPMPDFSGQVAKLQALITAESKPQLITLIQQAEQHARPYLVDDESFSLGYGAHAKTWPITALPSVESIDWAKHRAIPIALVTGTNGKSTSVRLIAHIINHAGLRSGMTSTDFIRVGSQTLARGDFSGSEGARTLLRHPEVEIAVLEVARGGLLRRGLPVAAVDVALVTNIAADHLGQYGINTLAALTASKLLVAKAVRGKLVLNADDAQLLAYVTEQAAILPPIIWFSLQADNARLLAAQAAGAETCFLRDGQIIYTAAGQEEHIIAANDILITRRGAARHNIQNALGAVALCKQLKLDLAAIRTGLQQFGSVPEDNPGRGNFYAYHGATVVLDYAHNVHGMDAMAATLQSLPAQRCLLMMCNPGDRADADIAALTRSAMAMRPDLLWAAELPDYRRGRAVGEVPAVIARAAEEAGLPTEAIHFAQSPLAAAREMLTQIQPGDVVFLMALSHRNEITDLLETDSV